MFNTFYHLKAGIHNFKVCQWGVEALYSSDIKLVLDVMNFEINDKFFFSIKQF